jgi:hypothetical protein
MYDIRAANVPDLKQYIEAISNDMLNHTTSSVSIILCMCLGDCIKCEMSF